MRHRRSSVQTQLGLVLVLPLQGSVDGNGDLLHCCGLQKTNDNQSINLLDRDTSDRDTLGWFSRLIQIDRTGTFIPVRVQAEILVVGP